MLHDLILQIAKFPGAESIHLLQGAVAGWLLVRGYLKKCLVRVSIAVVIIIAFAIYETLERWRINDPGDVDFQVALIAAWLTSMITLAYAMIREWLKERGEK